MLFSLSADIFFHFKGIPTECQTDSSKLFATAYADPESFARAGPTSTTFFFFFSCGGGGRIQNPLKVPSSTRQRNAIKMAFRWHADVGPTLNSGLVAL